MRTPVWIASICLSVAGCSPSAKQIEPIYVAPRQYQTLSCEEIAGEASRVARSAAMLAGAPAGAPSSDKVVVWPALASARPDDSTRLALGRLKGEFDALVLASSLKSCGIEFQQDSA